MIWVDLVTLGIIVVFALVGYYKGLIYSVLSLASFFVSIIVAKIVSTPFIEYVLKGYLKMDEWFRNIFLFYIDEKVGSNFFIENLRESAYEMAEGITKLIGIILVFIIVSIAIKLIIKALDAIIKSIPVVSELNTIGGFIFGFLRGLLIVWIIMGVLEYTAVIPDSERIINAISDSMFAKYLFYNNYLMIWLLPKLHIG